MLADTISFSEIAGVRLELEEVLETTSPVLPIDKR
jgi:hypothetical protein